MAPPLNPIAAVFTRNLQLLILSVPPFPAVLPFRIAPPSLLGLLQRVTVRLFSVRVPPEKIWNAGLELLPLIVITFPPSIVMFAVMVGKTPLVRTIVGVMTLKVTVPPPLRAAVSFARNWLGPPVSPGSVTT